MSDYELPAYRCTECDTKPWLMVDQTAGGAALGIGCECSLENGRPFKMLRGRPGNMPDHWVKE